MTAVKVIFVTGDGSEIESEPFNQGVLIIGRNLVDVASNTRIASICRHDDQWIYWDDERHYDHVFVQAI